MKCRKENSPEHLSLREDFISLTVFVPKVLNSRLVREITGPIQDIQSFADENSLLVLKIMQLRGTNVYNAVRLILHHTGNIFSELVK